MIVPLSQILLSILLPVCTGYALVDCLFANYKNPFGLRVSLGFGAGFGLTAFLMFLLSTFNIRISLPWIYCFLIASGACFVVGKKKSKNSGLNVRLFALNKEPPSQGLHRYIILAMITIMSLYLAYNVMYVFWRSLAYPVSSLEAVANTAYHAKWIFYERSLPPVEIMHGSRFSPLTSLLESWIAMNLEVWHESWVKLIFPCALTSLLLMVYAVLAHYTDRVWALLGCCLLVTSNYLVHYATISQAQFLAMYYNVSTVLLLCLWLKSRRIPFLLLAGGFAAVQLLASPQGPANVAVYVILFFLGNFIPKLFDLKQKVINGLIFLLPVVMVTAVILIFDAQVSSGNSAAQAGSPVGYEHISAFTVLDLIAQNLFFSGNWGIGWFLFSIGLIQIMRCQALPEVVILVLGIILFIQVDIATAVTSFEYALTVSKTDMLYYSRSILNYFPLAAVAFILLVYPNKLE